MVSNSTSLSARLKYSPELYPIIPEPREVFEQFAAVSAVPRESGHEEAIAEFMLDFAHNLGLEAQRDKVNNVIIRKPGTAGRENLPPLILQGHLDMVCVKRPESKHDFRRDPIKWRVEGDYLYADGTTLGGDDGIAVAYIMAVLASQNLPHPPLEILLTTSEETGMGGATELDGKALHGKTLLNLDSEWEGIFLASCAGGSNVSLHRPLQRIKCPAEQAFRLNVSGLQSGHSGAEIDKQRGNAIQLLGRALYCLNKRFGLLLTSVEGGSKHNAIAATAAAEFTLISDGSKRNSTDLLNMIANEVAELNAAFKLELASADPQVELTCEVGATVTATFTPDLSKDIIDLLYLLPHGVQEISPEIEGMVRTSLNLGVLHCENDVISLLISIRSSLASQKEYIRNKLILLAELCGFTADITTDYPAWEYAPKSPLRDLACKIHHELTGKDPVVTGIHAGLECGLLTEKIPGADMLSCGPNLYDVHTFNEHLSISSAGRIWQFLRALLAAYQG